MAASRDRRALILHWCTRRVTVLVGVVAVVAALLVAAAPLRSGAAAFDWKRFSGQTIKVWIHQSPGHTDYLKSRLSDFEALTGMKANLEVLDVTNYRKRLPVDLVAKSGDFDVMASMTVVEGLKYASAGWYEPLDRYVADAALTSPEWDFKDFAEGARQSMAVQGKIATVLFEAQTQLLFYRKDLFEKHGVRVPRTFDELEAAARALHGKEAGVVGIVLRGAGYQMTTPFMSFLYGMCGAWLKGGQPAINSPEALRAFEAYGRLGSKYGPPGAAAVQYTQVLEALAQGKAAMAIDINLFPATLEDPAKSKVVGKIGYAVVPGGPCGPKPFVAGWGFGINPYSKKKEQAWYWIQWATSKRMNLDLQVRGWPSPRTSAWESPEFKAGDKSPELTRANMESYRIGIPDMNPPVVAGLEARQIVGAVGDVALQGADAARIKEAADAAAKQLSALIGKTQ